jgi:hypothetical protein
MTVDPQLLQALGSLSGPAILAIIVLSGAKGVWMWTWGYRDSIAAFEKQLADKDKQIDKCENEAVYFRDIAFQVTNIAERQQVVAKTIADKVRENV